MIGRAGRWTQTASATPIQSKKMKCSFLDYIQLLMISWTGQWTQTPSTTPLQPKTWNACFWITFNFWWSARLVDALKPHLPPLSSQKNEMLIFGLHSTPDDQPGWSINLNPIYHLSPATKMKCSFLDYVQLLMISWIGQWTRTPSTTPLQPKTWNACFWITFNFWWLARLVDALEPHLPPLSSQKIEMLIFGLHSTPDDQPGWSMELNPIYHLSPAKKMKCSFLDYIQLLMISQAGWWTRTPSATPLQPKKWNPHFWNTFNFWWLARLVDGLKPHLPPISSQKNEMLILELCSTSDDQMAWLMDSNPICNPSAATKIKCLFLDYIHLLMIGKAGRWTQTPSTTHLQPKTWNAHFWITFNSWWSARLVDGLEPHLPPLSSHKNEMLIFGLRSTSDDQLDWTMDSNTIHHPSPAKKMKCSFLDYIQILMISQAGWWTRTPFATPLQPKKWNPNFLNTFNFSWLAGLVDGLEPQSPPLSTQKNEMPIFRLHSNSDDKPGWSMHLNPICHPSLAKKMKCSFLEYIQLLMIGQAGRWTQTPSATHLQPKKWNAHFGITFNFWWLARQVNGLKPHLPPISSQKNDMLIFRLHSTSDDQLGWSMDSNPICHPSTATKMKCSFLGYVQLLMISQAGQWTQTPSTTPLQPKTWNACFWITFNFWWSARLVDALEPHLPPVSSQKIECSFLDYLQLLMIARAGQWTWTPSTTSLQPKKWNAHFWITFNSWWLAGLVNGLEPHLPPISSQKNDMLIFGLHSTSDDQLGWSMDSNPICQPSPAKKIKCSF